MSRTLPTAFMIFLIASASTLLRAGDVETAVNHFYNDLQALEVRHNSAPKSLEKVLPSLTPSFRKAVAAEDEIGKAWEKAPKNITDQIAPANDGGIFTGVYEGGIFGKIITTEKIGDRAYVSVTLSGDGVVDSKDHKWTDMVILHLTDGKWLIDDILFDADGKHPSTARMAIIQYGALPPKELPPEKPDPKETPFEPRPPIPD